MRERVRRRESERDGDREMGVSTMFPGTDVLRFWYFNSRLA